MMMITMVKMISPTKVLTSKVCVKELQNKKEQRIETLGEILSIVSECPQKLAFVSRAEGGKPKEQDCTSERASQPTGSRSKS